jgi:DNA repair exonuclease SbcCD ATPase subunit
VESKIKKDDIELLYILENVSINEEKITTLICGKKKKCSETTLRKKLIRLTDEDTMNKLVNLVRERFGGFTQPKQSKTGLSRTVTPAKKTVVTPDPKHAKQKRQKSKGKSKDPIPSSRQLKPPLQQHNTKPAQNKTVQQPPMDTAIDKQTKTSNPAKKKKSAKQHKSKGQKKTGKSKIPQENLDILIQENTKLHSTIAFYQAWHENNQTKEHKEKELKKKIKALEDCNTKIKKESERILGLIPQFREKYEVAMKITKDTNQAKDDLEKLNAELQKNLKNSTNEANNIYNTQIDEQEKHIEKLETALQALKKINKAQHKIIKKQTESQNPLRTENTNLKATMEELTSQINTLEREKEALNLVIKKHHTELTKQQQSMNTNTNAIVAAAANSQHAADEINILKDKIKQLQTENQTLNQKIFENEQTVQNCQQLQQNYESQINHFDMINDMNNTLQQQVQQLQQQLEQMKQPSPFDKLDVVDTQDDHNNPMYLAPQSPGLFNSQDFVTDNLFDDVDTPSL